MSFLVSDVVNAVQRQFGDEASVQINESDIIRWVNDAVREICIQNDLKQATGTMNSAVGTNTYNFPSDLLSVRTVYFDSKRLETFSKADYDNYINENDPTETATGTPQLWTRWGSQFILYPVPDSVKAIKLLYQQIPVATAVVGDTVPVPDLYRSQIVNYCLQQAYQTDEDWEAANQMAGQFEDGLMRLKEKEQVASTEYYTSVTCLPDDSGY